MYTIFLIYKDFSYTTHKAENFPDALSACATWLQDPTCECVKIWNTQTGEILLDYWREH